MCHRRGRPVAPVLHRAQPGPPNCCRRYPGGLPRNKRWRPHAVAPTPRPHLRRTRGLPARRLARPIRLSRYTERTVAVDTSGKTYRGTRPPPGCSRPAHLDRPRDVAPHHPTVGPPSLHHPGVPRGVPVGRLVVSRLFGIFRRLPNPISHRRWTRRPVAGARTRL